MSCNFPSLISFLSNLILKSQATSVQNGTLNNQESLRRHHSRPNPLPIRHSLLKCPQEIDTNPLPPQISLLIRILYISDDYLLFTWLRMFRTRHARIRELLRSLAIRHHRNFSPRNKMVHRDLHASFPQTQRFHP